MYMFSVIRRRWGDWLEIGRDIQRRERQRDLKKLEKENYNVKNIDKKRATGNKHNKKSCFASVAGLLYSTLRKYYTVPLLRFRIIVKDSGFEPETAF